MPVRVDEDHEEPSRGGRLRSVGPPLAVIVAFALGMLFGSRAPAAARWSGGLMDALVGVYGSVAPLVIFFTAVPVLARLRRGQGTHGIFGYVFAWLAWKRLVACLFGVMITWLVFGFPALPSHGVSGPAAAARAVHTLAKLASSSPYFIAVYAGITVSIVAVRLPQVTTWLERLTHAVERAGGAFRYGIPLFMFFMGAYLYNLPTELARRMDGRDLTGAALQLSVGRIDLSGPGGIALAYVFISALVGVACLLFHLGSLYRVRRAIPSFSVRHYVVHYWLAIYPFLWASCSESLGTPLNLHLVRRLYPSVPPQLRLFVVGIGGWLNLNGSLICVFLLAGAAARIVGYDLSVLELLLAVPIAFLIGYVTPGLPGELIPFAAPIAAALHLPDPLVAPFIAIFIGFNFGLPDAFRTGLNSTDNCLSALRLLDALERRGSLTVDPAERARGDSP